jgi:hypothetical protein
VAEDLFDNAEHVANEDDLLDIVEEGGHIVVVGMGREPGALLPQLTTIIRQLRTPFFPEALLHVPIVVLYDYLPREKVSKFFGSYERLVYVKGSPLRLRSLLKVGADRCSKMLIVSGGNGSHQEPIMTDQDAILLLSMLESQEPLWGRLPTVICQLHVPSNIKQLSESSALEIALNKNNKGSAGDNAVEGNSIQDNSVEKCYSTQSSKNIRTHLRYASGCIIHRAEFSSLFAAAYYTPGQYTVVLIVTFVWQE